MSTEIRVRFAPSPTGYLHIGGVRTALYNYLFAKKNNGKFILRIEDTDTERSSEEYVNIIQAGLKWIGLDWDEGPVFQSKRGTLYKEALDKLINSDKVYKCYCTPEELKERREEARKKGVAGYDGRCRNLSVDKIKEFENADILPAYRIKMDKTGAMSFNDIIKGQIEIDASTLDDFVIAKRDGSPLYNFACVIDDNDLGITHVIRGDDHIYNTYKQMVIYEALGAEMPQFAHLPQVHGADGKKLSKRTGAVSLKEYEDKGYLPEALRNYLALIGWSTEDAQQIFKGNELTEKFDLSRCSISAGIFDTEKLNWMNGKYIRDLAPEDLIKRSIPWLKEEGLIKTEEDITEKIIESIKLEQEKIELLSEIPGRIDFIIKDDIEYDEKSVSKRLKKDGVRKILEDIKQIIGALDEFSSVKLEEEIKKYCEANDLGAGKVFHPVRVSVSGRMQGPGVFELLEILGREKVIKRIDYALNNLVGE